MMLLFGLLGELKIIDNKIAVTIGFFFYLTFKLIYDKYAKKHKRMKLFNFLVIYMDAVWYCYLNAIKSGFLKGRQISLDIDLRISMDYSSTILSATYSNY